ncbi:site-specific DNA-methyltransferase [Proteiniphilum sp. UBA1028]|jgi:adenine-specific DNA-methyltransferase|uniref:site-specific DNA-methyltransferase n=1 Tax=Proteiniphilum sp. UBA1028 TaxID=1947251 RepID=UPI0025F50B51|nr:DNA methyltransferase [Proteiniphilum sp. UBA1028]
MSNTKKLRERLLKKLTELFQLDQPDLDFGFYRIIQTKALQIKSFIDKDLLQIIEDAFGQIDEARKAELEANITRELEAAKEYGVADPEQSPKVMEARARYEALRDGATAEADIYDHLYRFFERYYDDGDFISRRYYARESAGKAAPFAIPYNGEEVKLHWANADQYYVKTADYFSNFSFDISQAVEIRTMTNDVKVLNGIPETPLKIHFRIIDASEGEHGNVKESEEKKRFFVLYEEKPVELNDSGELVVNFEYKSLPGGKNEVDPETEKALKEKFGRSLNKGDMPNLAMALKIKESVSQIDKESEYISALNLFAPTDKIPNRPLLTKYINQYTARNTRDYFIHKDLGSFLKRELDFYIKNEVMRLDDIENADAQAVEGYLAKIKVMRKIATKLIDFLAQLEDFQKKLWLKKKFVTETNYCITLDRVPEALYGEIASNDSQREEWVKLFAIDEIGVTQEEEKKKSKELFEDETISYTVPLTVEFLKANDKLVLDTAFFSDEFKTKLIESIENFDEQCDGLLIHSENFQALNLLQERYKDQVKCLYIDPPYNTGDSKILYKNVYDSSSWLSLMENRIKVSWPLLSEDFVYYIAIDDYEMVPLCEMIDTHLPFRREMIVINHHPQGGKAVTLANTHEYMLAMVGKDSDRTLVGRVINEDIEERPYKRSGTAESNFRYGRPNSFYAILVDPLTFAVVGVEEPPEKDLKDYPIENTSDGLKRIYPIGKGKTERVWRNAYETCKKLVEAGKLKCSSNFTIYQLIEHGEKKTALFSNWTDKKYNAGTYGANLLNDIIGPNPFGYPKSIFTVEDAIFTHSDLDGSLILDFFGGSGTTGHAVINLNKQDDLCRRFILVEMGNHFDTVLKPRILKVTYSSNWKNGKPTSRDTGISQCLKYIRLESYEDTLNNLEFDNNPDRGRAIEGNPSLKEDYMLHYLLNVETRGSQSLLNIDAFTDPTAYTLKIKKPGSDEQVEKQIDLIETFNYLIGLRLENMAAPQTFTASFIRKADPELPEDQHTKLLVDGKIQLDDDGKWWFRKVEGWVPADRMNPNNGIKEHVLIVWRKLTGNLEEDNLMLDEWFEKYRISTRDFEYDTIYVNGSNNLPNLRKDDENWKVRLIEEEFHKRMWDVEGEA